MQHKILSIEDDPTMQLLIQESLHAYKVDCLDRVSNLDNKLKDSNYCGFLVDIELPDGSGMQVIEKIRRLPQYAQAPIILLSGHGQIANKALAFSLGADDFIEKPFDPMELKIRLEAKIKKAQLNKESEIIRQIKDIKIDYAKRKVSINKKNRELDLMLTHIEFQLLDTLTKNLEHVFTREKLLDIVWGDISITDRTVDSHIAHLRKKLEGSELAIKTIKNMGYCAALRLDSRSR